MISINYRDPRPIYEQVKESLRRLIVTAVLAPREKLPSVRELATSLAINPNTIQRAYRELEASGYIASVPGKGSFVCDLPGAAGKETTALLETFDQTVQALLSMGITKEELILHIIKGGNPNA